MRGATLTFIGSNLDKIVEVQVSGVNAITDIEVVSGGSQSEIRVQLPDDGPEEGTITLVSSDGKTFTTQTELEYTEPIVLESFTPASTPAWSGDVVALKGDYMNLVKSVTFEGGATAEVTATDRYNASFIIPASAVTGKIILSDEGEIANLIYSETDLEIGDPSVTSIAATWKPGNTVTIKGSHLDMIEEVHFQGAGDSGTLTTVSDLTISSDCKTLTLSLPAEAQSGTVTAVSYAGKEFGSTETEMVKPSGLSTSPSPVKAGNALSVTGKDLDVVTSVDFPGASEVSFVLKDSALEITSVPETATEGDITLKMANGESVTVTYTLVHPTVTAVSPTALTAGEAIEVTGTDLDLVTGATLGGRDVEVSAEEGKVTVTTAATSVSGKLVLSLANGETVECPDEITLSYDSYIVVNDMPASARINTLVTLKGTNFNMIEAIYIGETKVTSYSQRADDEIRFLMPDTPGIGLMDVKFVLTTGEEEICPSQIEVLLAMNETTIWEGNTSIGNWDGSMSALSWGGYDWSTVSAGTYMTIYITNRPDVADYSQLRIGNGSWAALPGTSDPYSLDNSTTAVQIVLTQAMIDELVNNGGLVLCGAYWTVTKITLGVEVSKETTIWEGSEYSGENYNNNLTLGSEDDWVNAGLEEGDTVYIYFTAESETDWQIQVFGGHWDSMTFDETGGTNQFNAENSPTAFSDGRIAFKVTSAHYSIMTSKQYWGGAIILQGKGITFSKITFL